MRKNEIKFLFGVVLVVIGLTILIIPYVIEKNEGKSDLDKVNKYIEETSIKESKNVNEDEKDINKEIDEEIDEEKESEEEAKQDIKISNKEDNYIMILEIPKINLKRGILAKDAKDNNIQKNVTILKESDYPDKENGNVYIASHNGTAKISYFRELHKLDINDIAIIYYKGIKYTYKVDKIYDVLKDGDVEVERDKDKTTLTLITCKKNTKDRHLVIILYLEKMEEY
ncbi:MAG: sortase [Bacilli bacterium]|nr:sortase [Bacilli bacterium]